MKNLENLKSFILTILIVLSLVLTGSLWFDNYQGLSFAVSTFYDNIVHGFSNDMESLIVYDKIILPYKVTVIEPEKNKWVFYESSNINNNAWNIIKDKLNNLDENSRIITGKVTEWDNLFSRKSIIFEFGGPLEYDVLKLVIPNLPKENEAFSNIEKIGITKSLEGNTIYIFQSDNNIKKLYKILLKGEDKKLEKFMEDCNNVKTFVKYVDLEDVGTTKFYKNKEITHKNEALFPVYNSSNRRETVVSLSNIAHFKFEEEYLMNRFITNVFNNTDFAKFVTNDESNIFINDDKSLIKFEKNGVVEYTNNSKLSGETVSLNKSFNLAMNFINNMRIYDDVYLLSATEEEGEYTFKFSLAYNGIMVGFEKPIIGNDKHTIIEIKVKEDSIRYFKGKLLDINLNKNEKYITSFTHNILDNLLKNVDENKKIKVSCVELMYLIDNEGTYYPNWYVKYNEKDLDDQISLTYTVSR